MNALAIRTTLESSGAKAAEKQLALLSHDQGDEQLAVIVAELSAGEVGELLQEGDFTKPSVVTPFVSVAQLIGAVERIGARWGDLGDSDANVLLTLKRQVSDLLFPVLLHGEVAHRNLLLRGLLKNNLTEDVIVALPLFEHGCPEFLTDFDTSQSQHGTWQEVYAEIHALDERTFERVKAEVLSLFPRPEGEEEEAGSDEDAEPGDSKKAVRHLKRTLQALANKAAALVGSDPAAQRPEDPFAPV